MSSAARQTGLGKVTAMRNRSAWSDALSVATRVARARGSRNCESEAPGPSSAHAVASLPPSGGLRVGIATLHYAPAPLTQQAQRCHALGCALLAWCAAAVRLQGVLPWHSDVLLLEAEAPQDRGDQQQTPQAMPACAENRPDARDCPASVMRLRPSASLVALVQRHVMAQARRLREQRAPPRYSAFLRRMGGQLLKWALFSLVSFDAILFADLDVDLFPERLRPAAVRSEWAARLPLVLGGGAAAASATHLVAHPDFSSPINGGLFLLRPSTALYHDGLRVLATAFDEQSGWNRSGTPRSLLGRQALLRHDGTPLTHGYGRARKAARVDNDAGRAVRKRAFFPHTPSQGLCCSTNPPPRGCLAAPSVQPCRSGARPGAAPRRWPASDGLPRG